jgi:adenylylsulfate kinase
MYDHNRVTGSFIMIDPGLTVWFTGLSGAGKTTISEAVAAELSARGLQVEVIDGDVIRKNLCSDLGFSKQDREENCRRIAFVSQLLTRNGIIVLVSAISPYRSAREAARKSIGHFIEVYVSTPLPVCERRDAKGLYKMARAGRLSGLTGIDDPYEAPLAPDIECNTEFTSTRDISSKVVAKILEHLSSRTSLA